MVKVSVPGKIHLIGEHTVVYGMPAILASIGLRCTVEAEKSANIHIIEKRYGRESIFDVKEALEMANRMDSLWASCKEKKNFTEVFEALKGNGYGNADRAFAGKVMKELGIKSGFKLIIQSNIPNGSGLGSSSAYSVAITKAVAELFGKKLSNEEINSIAYKLEQYNHGAPSGGDNSVCCFGGLLWFQKANPKPIILSLKEEIPQKLENFVFAYSVKPEKTTGELVQMVMNMPKEKRMPIIYEIAKLTYEMRDVLKEKNYNRMKEIINLTQDNLAKLGVSVPEIDRIVEKIRSIGGAAKGCGALGGGIVLCWHENKQKLLEALKEIGKEPIEVDLGVEGVRMEG